MSIYTIFLVWYNISRKKSYGGHDGMKFIVESERLLIRPFKKTDAKEYYEMTTDSLIRSYVPFAFEESYEATYEMIDNYYSHGDCVYDFYLVLEEKETHKIIGAIIATAIRTYPLSLDVCILTDAAHRKQGFMFEALIAFKDALPKSTELIFVIDRTNEASIKTITKLPGIVEKPLESPLKKKVYQFSLMT